MLDFYSLIQKAIAIAKKGSGYVHPNPLVGCVITYDNQIISEGYHPYYGGPHAEVNAIRALEKTGFQNWDQVVLYVTLEPCSHYGKTPPCTNLILEKGIKKVVVATTDPNPLVAGSGIRKLKENGVEVITGVLEAEAIELNKRFFTYHQQKRPYIILKWAETKDGFVSKKYVSSRSENIISSKEALKIVHEWRSEEHSILVGYQTVIADNPQLNVRLVSGKNPVRIILDKWASLSTQDYQVFLPTEKVIVFNTIKEEKINHIEYIRIHWENFTDEVMEKLYQRNIVSVLIEGGRKTLQKFIDNRLFDEIRIIKSKTKTFEEGIPAPVVPSDIQLINRLDLEEDEIVFYRK